MEDISLAKLGAVKKKNLSWNFYLGKTIFAKQVFDKKLFSVPKNLSIKIMIFRKKKFSCEKNVQFFAKKCFFCEKKL